MDANKGGTSNVEHIIIKYELDESPGGEAGFHDSYDGTVVVEAVPNEDGYASSIVDNLEGSKATCYELISAAQSPDESSSVLSIDSNEDGPADEEHFEVVLQQASGGNSEGSDVIAQGIIMANKISNEVIEIDDSSEEETPNPVVSESECTSELPNFPKEQYVVITGNRQSSSATHIRRTGESTLYVQAFEDAMDDWYSKLSAHGSLKDCEIMESARQLAQHFSFDFQDDVQWLRAFRKRQLNNRAMSNKNGAGGKGGGRENSETMKVKLKSAIRRRAKKNDGRNTPSSPESWVKCSDVGQFRLSQEKLSESPDYPLLLRRAQNAEPSGRSGDRDLFVTKKVRMPIWKPNKTNTHLNRVMPVLTLDNESVAASGGDEGPPLGALEAPILQWYFSLTSQHKTMVAPCIFESKAVEIAQCMELFDFHPSKTWMERFIRRHGIWCTLSQSRSLFLEPKAGILKYRFDAEFEAWYHVFPDSPESIVDYYLASKKLDFRLKLKKYLSALFHWYTSQTSVVSANDILTAEAQHAEEIGISDKDVLAVRELYRDWCARHKQFNESVREAYNVGLPIMLPHTLRHVSLRWAFASDFNGFTPSQFWMRRYVQLNGLFYKKDEVVKWYRLDSSSCGHVVFDHIFRVWEGATAKGYALLKEILDEKFRENEDDTRPSNRLANIPEEPETPLKILQTFTLWSGAQSTTL